MAMASDARDDAVQRLQAALDEQDRLLDRYRAATGTKREVSAYYDLRVGSDEVVAREAWLDSVDDDGLGGRLWVNGREVGGLDSIFQGVEDSHG